MQQETFYKVCWGLVAFFCFGLIICLMLLSSGSSNQDYNTLKPLSQEEAKPQEIQHYEQMRDESVRATEELNKEPVNNTQEINQSQNVGALLNVTSIVDGMTNNIASIAVGIMMYVVFSTFMDRRPRINPLGLAFALLNAGFVASIGLDSFYVMAITVFSLFFNPFRSIGNF